MKKNLIHIIVVLLIIFLNNGCFQGNNNGQSSRVGRSDVLSVSASPAMNSETQLSAVGLSPTTLPKSDPNKLMCDRLTAKVITDACGVASDSLTLSSMEDGNKYRCSIHYLKGGALEALKTVGEFSQAGATNANPSIYLREEKPYLDDAYDIHVSSGMEAPGEAYLLSRSKQQVSRYEIIFHRGISAGGGGLLYRVQLDEKRCPNASVAVKDMAVLFDNSLMREPDPEMKWFSYADYKLSQQEVWTAPVPNEACLTTECFEDHFSACIPGWGWIRHPDGEVITRYTISEAEDEERFCTVKIQSGAINSFPDGTMSCAFQGRKSFGSELREILRTNEKDLRNKVLIFGHTGLYCEGDITYFKEHHPFWPDTD